MMTDVIPKWDPEKVHTPMGRDPDRDARYRCYHHRQLAASRHVEDAPEPLPLSQRMFWLPLAIGLIAGSLAWALWMLVRSVAA